MLLERAQLAINVHNGLLSEKFLTLINFLHENENARPKLKDLEFGSEQYLDKLSFQFVQGRAVRDPSFPKTVTDTMVPFIMIHYFGVEIGNSELAVHHHKMAMGAENIIGHLLESYIADCIEESGWVWCSGSVAKDIDFIKNDDTKWIVLQVKNRDNSENNASKRVRVGTEIKHWFRTFSRREGDNWAKFPLNEGGGMNEDGFKDYVFKCLTQRPDN